MSYDKKFSYSAIFSVLCATLVACGGGGTGGALPVGPIASTGVPAVRAQQAPTIQTSGTIAGISTNMFTLQTGYPHGFIHVYTNPSTNFIGAKPFVGESVSVVATGSWSSYLTALSVTQAGVGIQTGGTIAGLITNMFTLQTGYPHGYIHIYTSSSTVFIGAKPFIGECVAVTGSGSWSTYITAATVTQCGSGSPTPHPTATPSTEPTATPSAAPTPTIPPNGPNNVTIMRSAPGTFGLTQIFDEYTPRIITSSQSASDGPRYGVVWGARPGNAQNWNANTQTLVPAYYAPQETDMSYNAWGDAGHNLAWWTANHPDWILYACTSSGTPTGTPAYIAQLPGNIPLDIHNPAVVAYQVQAAGNYAVANHYSGLAFDEVLFTNVTGSGLGSGYYGCGIYENGTFVRRYNGQGDSAWKSDTVAWVQAAHSILAHDPILGPAHLKLIVNHPAGNISDPSEQAILQNTDADLDETGFSDYGNWHASSSLFKLTADWMRYAQAVGSAPLIIDKFSQTAPVTSEQTEYSLATYLIGSEGGSGLFVGNSNSYGAEQYLSQYQTSMGAPCGDYYGGPTLDPNNPAIWYRKFANALVVVNGGSTTNEIAHLPTNHTYSDIMGRQISNPLSVASGDAYVLLANGNGCE